MLEYAVINTCYGGFGISEKARNLMGVTKAQIYQIERNNKLLVDVVRRLGQEASDKHAKLVAVKLRP